MSTRTEPSPPKRSRANTDGDAGSMGVKTVKGVTLQDPPQITSFAHEDLVRWKHERIMYEETVQNRCAETGESIASVQRPVLKCINKRLLRSFSEFELHIPVEQMTEEQLVTAIDNILGSVINDIIPDVMGIMARHLKLDLTQKDVKARILDYFDSMEEVIEVHGLGASLRNNVKLKCKVLVENLRPATLKDQVKRAIEYDPSLKSNVHRLFDLVKQEAIRNQQAFDLYQRIDKRDHSNRDNKRQAKKPDHTGTHNGVGDQRRPTMPPRKKREGLPPGGCLYCRKSEHWLEDCPTATENQKKETMKSFLDNKRRDKDTTTLKRLVTGGDIDVREVVFNDLVAMPYCLDNGTTHNAIPRSMVEEIQLLDSSVHLRQLEPPVRGKAVGGAYITCTEYVELDIGLQTVAGRVNIRGLTCIITETDEDEFLLGSKTLKSLGIDVDELLAGLVAKGTADIDPFEDDRDYKSIEQPDRDAIHNRLKEMVAEAVNNGFPAHRSDELFEIVSKRDIWRLQISDDPPARLPPFKIRLKDGAEPYRCKPRKYAPAQREFLRVFNDQLIKLGWVYKNPDSRWACPALPVRKPGKANAWRQTIDFRLVNALTVPLAGGMTNNDTHLEDVRDKEHKQTADFIKSFFQAPLAAESQECQSYMTADGEVITPTRLQQGSVDSSLQFQQSIEKVMREKDLLFKNVLVWVDDLLIYAKTIDEFLETIDVIYSQLEKYGLFLGMDKTCLYTNTAKWCGRVLTKDGVAYDPEKIQALAHMPPPATAGALQQFLCAAGWMRSSLVDYARISQPLQARLDNELAGTRRTKRVAANISIELTPLEVESFQAVKKLLENAATLAFPDPEGTICMFSDASNDGCSIIVTSVKEWNKSTAAKNQQHDLLYCMSGTFHGASHNWSIVEKEGYPIIRACSELDYLLIRDKGFKIFTDHRNLIYIFAPGAEIKKHVRGKLLRWSLKLNEYQYEIEHIPGEQNVWADMFSRWAGQELTAARTASMKRWKHGQTSKLRPLVNLEWPTNADIAAAQSGKVAPLSHTLDDRGVYVDSFKRPWIPSTAEELLQRIMIVARCGSQGHRGVNAMIQELEGFFDISNVQVKARSFCCSCLLCCHVKGGNIIPRSYGELYRSSDRNEALHMDYLYVGKYDDTSDYILVLKDDYSHFCELIPCNKPTALTAAESVLQWSMRFATPKILISDTARHFKNELLAELCRCTHTEQNFTVAYCPWINGSVERINRDILQVLRVMILEFKLKQEQWVDILPLVQANLNQTPAQSLANLSPMEVFTGMERPSPLQSIVVSSGTDKEQVVTLEDFSASIQEKLTALRQTMHIMHKKITTAKTKQTNRNQRNQRVAHPVNFHVGDYVLWSRVESRLKSNKLSVKWVGPFRVIGTKQNSFTVEHLLNGSIRDVHASRLKHYADSSFEVTEEVIEHIANQDIYLTVREFVGHRRSDQHGYEICVAWEGLEDIENSWEPIKMMHEDVKVKLQQYADQAGDSQLTAHIQKLNSDSGDHERITGPIPPTPEVPVQQTPKQRKQRRSGKSRATAKLKAQH